MIGLDIFGNEVNSIYAIEGKYVRKGVGNSWFEATIVTKDHPDAIEFKPLIQKNKIIPKYYVATCGKYLSTKRGVRILDYTRKRRKQSKNYLVPLAFNYSVEVDFFDDYAYTAQSNSQQGKLKKNINPNCRYHRGVKETWEPLETHSYEIGITANEWSLLSEDCKKVLRSSIYVDHIDNDTSNNNITNLKWCTPKENSQHR